MERQLKQRIVGASVLCAVAVILVPMLFDDSEPGTARIEETHIPAPPEPGFSSRIVPLDANPPPPEPQPERKPPPAAAPVPPRAAQPAGAETQPEPERGEAQNGGGSGETDTRVGLTAWAVQVGSFTKQSNASGLERRLRQAGYSAFVEKLVGEDDTIFRVRVGPELLRADAETLRDELAGEVDLEAIVVRYP